MSDAESELLEVIKQKNDAKVIACYVAWQEASARAAKLYMEMIQAMAERANV